MYKLLLTSAAALALASPASARDGSGYVGLELGMSIDTDAEFDLRASDGTDVVDLDDAFKIDFRPGRDFDLIAGYDLGLVRVEAELGYKRVTLGTVNFDDDLEDALEDDLGDLDFDVSGRATSYSLMGNVLFDVLNVEGASAFIGAGAGRARVKMLGETDSAWAWQLLAGMRTPVSSNVDVGVKYRFFNTRKLRFSENDEDFSITSNGKLKSHSVLVSLIYNFAGAPVAPPPVVVAEPAPPPPPPPPATQTCPDGSVILATDACPPPPPPPPPAPEPERG